MSKFVLTKFEKSLTDAIYKNYEEPLKPSMGENIFIYDITDTVSKINEANRNIVKKIMGWAKLDKIANMTSA
jgi:predicted transcriptional regulator